jgi:hypothetical protein
MASASDDFGAYSDGYLSIVASGIWVDTVSGQAPKVSSHVAIADPIGNNLSGAHYVATSFAGDHEAQITKANASDYQGPGVRMATTGGGRGYSYFDSGSVQKIVAGINTEIAATTAFANGDTAAIRAVSSTLTWYKNGSLVNTVTDSAVGAGGAPGFWFHGTIASLDDWSATDSFGGAAASRPIFRRSTRFFTRRF